jgi:hypothetical protein
MTSRGLAQFLCFFGVRFWGCSVECGLVWEAASICLGMHAQRISSLCIMHESPVEPFLTQGFCIVSPALPCAVLHLTHRRTCLRPLQLLSRCVVCCWPSPSPRRCRSMCHR